MESRAAPTPAHFSAARTFPPRHPRLWATPAPPPLPASWNRESGSTGPPCYRASPALSGPGCRAWKSSAACCRADPQDPELVASRPGQQLRLSPAFPLRPSLVSPLSRPPFHRPLPRTPTTACEPNTASCLSESSANEGFSASAGSKHGLRFSRETKYPSTSALVVGSAAAARLAFSSQPANVRLALSPHNL